MADAKAVGSIPTGRSITGGSFVSRKETIYVIVMLFLGAGILFCAGAIKMGQMMDEENKQLYSGYAEPTTESNAEDDAETEYVPVHVDWSALRKKNNEVVGWVWVDADSEDDIISYPVMYRAGDREYYLRHNIGKQYSKYGTPYIPGDYDLDGKAVSIHGHNFGSDAETMFSPLINMTAHRLMPERIAGITCKPTFFQTKNTPIGWQKQKQGAFSRLVRCRAVMHKWLSYPLARLRRLRVFAAWYSLIGR